MNNLQDIAAFLLEADDFLVVSHAKPDGDAAGSALAMTQFLRDNGKKADALFADDMPDKFKKLTELDILNSVADWQSNTKYKNLLVLDCARSSRINAMEKIEDFNGTVVNIDHHVDNDVKGDLNLVCSNASACAAIVTEIAQYLMQTANWKLSEACATALYLGIVTDTGSFRFSNTDSRTLRIAADLLEYGAKSDKVINTAFFSKKEKQQKFEADMVLNCVKREFDGRYIYACLTQEMFEKYNFDMKDGEGVIEFLREIEGGVIASLIYPKNNTVKVSLRSKDARYPVGPVARYFNGGGHEMASGITFENMSVEDVAAALKEKIGEIL